MSAVRCERKRCASSAWRVKGTAMCTPPPRRAPPRHRAAPRRADTGATAPRTGEGARIQLREEELQVHKQLVEVGAVRVRKEVVTEHRTIEVPVQREEIVIERHAPNGAPSPTPTSGPARRSTSR